MKKKLKTVGKVILAIIVFSKGWNLIQNAIFYNISEYNVIFRCGALIGPILIFLGLGIIGSICEESAD